MTPTIDTFERCTTHTQTGEYHDIECRLGLWSVSGMSKEEIYRESWYYFLQYYADGEYETLLKTKD